MKWGGWGGGEEEEEDEGDEACEGEVRATKEEASDLQQGRLGEEGMSSESESSEMGGREGGRRR